MNYPPSHPRFSNPGLSARLIREEAARRVQHSILERYERAQRAERAEAERAETGHTRKGQLQNGQDPIDSFLQENSEQPWSSMLRSSSERLRSVDWLLEHATEAMERHGQRYPGRERGLGWISGRSTAGSQLHFSVNALSRAFDHRPELYELVSNQDYRPLDPSEAVINDRIYSDPHDMVDAIQELVADARDNLRWTVQHQDEDRGWIDQLPTRASDKLDPQEKAWREGFDSAVAEVEGLVQRAERTVERARQKLDEPEPDAPLASAKLTPRELASQIARSRGVKSPDELNADKNLDLLASTISREFRGSAQRVKDTRRLGEHLDQDERILDALCRIIADHGDRFTSVATQPSHQQPDIIGIDAEDSKRRAGFEELSRVTKYSRDPRLGDVAAQLLGQSESVEGHNYIDELREEAERDAQIRYRRDDLDQGQLEQKEPTPDPRDRQRDHLSWLWRGRGRDADPDTSKTPSGATLEKQQSADQELRDQRARERQLRDQQAAEFHRLWDNYNRQDGGVRRVLKPRDRDMEQPATPDMTARGRDKDSRDKDSRDKDSRDKEKDTRDPGDLDKREWGHLSLVPDLVPDLEPEPTPTGRDEPERDGPERDRPGRDGPGPDDGPSGPGGWDF